jgi:predicted TIM-barrel fold metal-dependent hydrolase
VIPLLDTHQHLLYSERLPYSWTNGIPQLEGRALEYGDYLDAAAGCGIEAAVFMESGVDEPAIADETALAESLASDPGTVINGIVAACRPEGEGFPSFLDALRGTRVIGLRRILHVVPDEVSQGARFRENVASLAEHNLSFDLCVLARQLPLGAELVAACPETRFVLDHCGVPDIAGGEFDAWRDGIDRLAGFPSVSCKISGVLAYCDPADAGIDAVRPYVEHCIDAFGWDRVVWGGDWPVVLLTSSLREWAGITRELVAGEPEENQRKLFHENAQRIYRQGADDE